MFQNANLSVRLTDEFMEAVSEDKIWKTRWVSDKCTAEAPTYRARDVLNRMSECAWHCGDPGVQYDTTINKWHTCPNSGRINASNPCSEYMFLDNTACNLSSINLMKFRQDDGKFNHHGFMNACRLFFIAQEILVDHASYPTPRIARNSHLYRPLGLGYSNLGSLLMADGLAYDSDAGRGLCGALTAILHGAANRTSAELAAAVGPFEGFAANREPMLNVMRMHRDAVEQFELMKAFQIGERDDTFVHQDRKRAKSPERAVSRQAISRERLLECGQARIRQAPCDGQRGRLVVAAIRVCPDERIRSECAQALADGNISRGGATDLHVEVTEATFSRASDGVFEFVRRADVDRPAQRHGSALRLSPARSRG
jgi:ribonucleotide reductase alpha subunit